MKSKSQKLITRLVAVCVLSVLGVGLGAAALEVGVRLFFPVSDFFWQWDPAIGMKLIPGKRGRAVLRGVFDTWVEVNSVGFRDREHPIDKPAGTRRIVFLGDSFLEAMQVPVEDTVSRQLEDRLQSGGRTESINFGISGFGTARQYLTLREYGLQYKPDLVLLFVVGNDISDNSRRLQGLSYVPYPQATPDGGLARNEAGRPLFTPFADQKSWLSSLAGGLKDHSKGYRFMRETVDNSPGLNELLYRLRLVSTPPNKVNAPSADNFGFFEIYRVQPKPVWAEAWRLTEELLVSARDLAAENGAKFGVVLIPAFWEVDAQRWSEALIQLPAMRDAAVDLELPSKRLTNFLSAEGIPVMNLLPEFRGRAAGMPPLYFRGDAHWTAAGHQLAAELLTEPVNRLLGSNSDHLATANSNGVR